MGKQGKVTIGQLRQLVRESVVVLEARTLDVSALEKAAKAASEPLSSIGVDLLDPDASHDPDGLAKTVKKADYEGVLKAFQRALAAWQKLYAAVSKYVHTPKGRSDFEVQDLYDLSSNAVDVCHEYIDAIEYFYDEMEGEEWSEGVEVAKDIYNAAYNAYMTSYSQTPEDAFAGAKQAAERLSAQFPFLRKNIYYGEGAFPIILRGVKDHNKWGQLSDKAKRAIEDALRA